MTSEQLRAVCFFIHQKGGGFRWLIKSKFTTRARSAWKTRFLFHFASVCWESQLRKSSSSAGLSWNGKVSPVWMDGTWVVNKPKNCWLFSWGVQIERFVMLNCSLKKEVRFVDVPPQAMLLCSEPDWSNVSFLKYLRKYKINISSLPQRIKLFFFHQPKVNFVDVPPRATMLWRNQIPTFHCEIAVPTNVSQFTANAQKPSTNLFAKGFSPHFKEGLPVRSSSRLHKQREAD